MDPRHCRKEQVFIDIFIGVWAFVLGHIWTNHIKVPIEKKLIGSALECFFSSYWRRSITSYPI